MRKNIFNYLFQYTKYFIRNSKEIYTYNKINYIIYIILTLFVSIGSYITLMWTSYIINVFSNVNIELSVSKSTILSLLLYMSLILGLIFITYLKKLVMHKFYNSIDIAIEGNINNKLINIDYEYYESYTIYDSLEKLQSKSVPAYKNLTTDYLNILSYIINIIVYIVLLMNVSYFFPLIILCLLIVMNYVSRPILKKAYQLENQIYFASRKQNYFLNLYTTKNSHEEVQFNRLNNFFSKKWADSYIDENNISRKVTKSVFLMDFLSRLFSNVVIVLAIIYIGYLTYNSNITIGYFVMSVPLLMKFSNSIGLLNFQLQSLDLKNDYLDNYYYIMGLNEVKLTNKTTQNINYKLSNVKYMYPQSNSYALNGIDIEINQGDKVAIVGHNGSGKTTLTNILCGLVECNHGTFNVNNTLYNFRSGMLINNVACIYQDFIQYNMTIKENVTISNPNKIFTDEEIEDLLDSVGLLEYIKKLPDGIHTFLGELNKGTNLSKGQWQRIALARLLANENSKVWILDEPTAYLDPIAEIELYKLLYEKAGNRTVIFISHRLGFCKFVDNVYVMDNGKICQSGSHEKLNNIDGIYKNMYTIQKEWYN